MPFTKSYSLSNTQGRVPGIFQDVVELLGVWLGTEKEVQGSRIPPRESYRIREDEGALGLSLESKFQQGLLQVPKIHLQLLLSEEGNFRWWGNDLNKIIVESAWVEGNERLGLNLKATIYKMCFSVELFVQNTLFFQRWDIQLWLDEVKEKSEEPPALCTFFYRVGN